MFSRGGKIILQLSPNNASSAHTHQGPVAASPFNSVRLVFKQGGEEDVSNRDCVCEYYRFCLVLQKVSRSIDKKVMATNAVKFEFSRSELCVIVIKSFKSSSLVKVHRQQFVLSVYRASNDVLSNKTTKHKKILVKHLKI
jgi:hypothetical protein